VTDAGEVHVHSTVRQAYRAYRDRSDAGSELASWIAPHPDASALVLALPRGGVPIGRAMADRLGCALLPVLVRKLPIPSSPEMGFGAITIDGTMILNEAVVDAYGLTPGTIRHVARVTRDEVVRRARAFPGGWPLPQLEDTDVWLVDDGLATGYSAIAAARMVRARGVSTLSLAVPCGPLSSIARVASEVDDVWCAIGQAGGAFAVASYYDDFHDLSDVEVVALLV
jgi:putative phosphoribosyl transferase